MLWRGDCRRGTALIHIVASRVGESQAARALGASVTVAPCAPASNYWLTDGSRKQEVRRRPLVSAGVRDSGRLRRSCWQVRPRAVSVGTERAFWTTGAARAEVAGGRRTFCTAGRDTAAGRRSAARSRGAG